MNAESDSRFSNVILVCFALYKEKAYLLLCLQYTYFGASGGGAENGRPEIGRPERDRPNWTKNGRDEIGRPENDRPNFHTLKVDNWQTNTHLTRRQHHVNSGQDSDQHQLVQSVLRTRRPYVWGEWCTFFAKITRLRLRLRTILDRKLSIKNGPRFGVSVYQAYSVNDIFKTHLLTIALFPLCFRYFCAI